MSAEEISSEEIVARFGRQYLDNANVHSAPPDVLRLGVALGQIVELAVEKALNSGGDPRRAAIIAEGIIGMGTCEYEDFLARALGIDTMSEADREILRNEGQSMGTTFYNRQIE